MGQEEELTHTGEQVPGLGAAQPQAKDCQALVEARGGKERVRVAELGSDAG